MAMNDYDVNSKLNSVIIPVYNIEQYLPRCLDSIINNTYQNYEIICVKDGSKDASEEILRSYALQNSRGTVPNAG